MTKIRKKLILRFRYFSNTLQQEVYCSKPIFSRNGVIVFVVPFTSFLRKVEGMIFIFFFSVYVKTSEKNIQQNWWNTVQLTELLKSSDGNTSCVFILFAFLNYYSKISLYSATSNFSINNLKKTRNNTYNSTQKK